LTTEKNSPLKLADFGLATLLKPQESLNQFCGTPTYLAPEIVSSSGYGKPVDIWAIGVISYILVCGRPPFHDESLPKLFQLIRNNEISYEYRCFQDVSSEAKDFIQKLLEADPSKRLTADDTLNHPWISTLTDLNEVKVLDEAKSNLQEFNTKRRLKSIVHVIQAARYFRKPSPLRDQAESVETPTVPVEGTKFKRFPPATLSTNIVSKGSKHDLISPTDSMGATTVSTKSSISGTISFPPTPDTPDIESFPLSNRSQRYPSTSGMATFSPIYSSKPLPMIDETSHLPLLLPSESQSSNEALNEEESITPTLPRIQSSTWLEPSSTLTVNTCFSKDEALTNQDRDSFSTEKSSGQSLDSSSHNIETPGMPIHNLSLTVDATIKTSRSLATSSTSPRGRTLPAIVRKKSGVMLSSMDDSQSVVSPSSGQKNAGVITSLSLDTSSYFHASNDEMATTAKQYQTRISPRITQPAIRKTSTVLKLESLPISRNTSQESLKEASALSAGRPKSAARKPLEDLPSPSNNRLTRLEKDEEL
jgi:hypothetical protein